MHSGSTSIFWALIRSLRPHQWVKNLTCLAGVIFSGRLTHLEDVVKAGFGILSFCLCSSAVYLLNDICDKEKDKLNPRTAIRPIALGVISLSVATTAMLVLFGIAEGIALYLGWNCVIVITIYVFLNIGYTVRLKRTVIADVMCIAMGFVLRVLYGVYAIEVIPSPWIFLCMFFLALFLGFTKRRGELVDLELESEKHRPVLRKYTKQYLDLAICITATITIVCYVSFSLAPHHNSTMVVTVVPVVYCILRYAHQVIVEQHGQSPESLILHDRMLWIGVISWALLCLAILYGGLNVVAVPEK